MKNSLEKKMYKLEFENKVGAPDFNVDDFLDVFEKSLKVVSQNKQLEKNAGMIHLTLITDNEIRLINQKYRKIDKATDVISLSYLEGDTFPGEDLVGEIFISVETAKRQAGDHNKTLKDEVLFLFVHGVLHVFGFDHETKEDRNIMFALQERII